MSDKRELFELVTEFAGKLREQGVTEFEGLGIRMKLDGAEPVPAHVLAKMLADMSDDDDSSEPHANAMDDPATYPGGYMPRLRRTEQQ